MSSKRPLTQESDGPRVHETPDGVPYGLGQLGVDGAGHEHYYAMYNRTVYVHDPEADETEQWPLEETPYETLLQWAAHVKVKRGLWEELKMDYAVRRRLEAGVDD